MAADSRTDRPNIVLIETDQHHWEALGAYGHPVVRTPNIDELARRGVRFDHAYVTTPLCMPSRASLFTGLHTTNHGLRINETHPLPPELPTLAEILKRSGYTTLLTGKDHLYDSDRYFDEPAGSERQRAAFDHVDTFNHFGHEPGQTERPCDERLREWRKAVVRGKKWAIEPFPPEECTTARITDSAIEFVDRAQGNPFFLWLSYPDPHPPFVAAEPYASMYRDANIPPPRTRPGELEGKPLRQRVSARLLQMEEFSADDIRTVRQFYYGMITFIDDQVGRFLKHLEGRGLRENTIVVFTADHGEFLGDHAMLRKVPAMYDSLVRVPLIVTWEKGLSGDRAIKDTMVENVDLMPTLLDWAGLPSPPNIHGRSLVPLLSGRTTRHRERVHGSYGFEGRAYSEAEVARVDFDSMFKRPYKYGNWTSPLVMQGPFYMVRSFDWKLVYYSNGEGELYDLRSDPDELTNLYRSGSHPEVERELLEDLVQWAMSTDRVDPPVQSPQLVPPFRAT